MDRSSQRTAVVEQLLAKARAGDRAALDRLFGLCRSYVQVLAQAQLASGLKAKVDASDLVQQTLLDAYRGFAGFRGATHGQWLGWLKQMLCHNAADYVRQYYQADKRRLAREVQWQGAGRSSAEPMQLPDGDLTPSEALAAREDELLLASALAELDDDYREVILLRNLQRLPFAEVAERMQRTRPAVQMLWMRAIQKLQSLMIADDLHGSS